MLIAVLALMLALFTQSIGSAHTNDQKRNILTFVSRVCLTISLVLAPWSLKFLIVAAVFFIPNCTWTSSNGTFHCSQQCIARSNCSHPHH